MDTKPLYEKAEKAINQAFKLTKESVKMVSEKAGEAAQITKLLIEKVALEHRASKQFAKLGHQVYEKALRQGETISLKDSKFKDLIEETKKLDVELAQVEATLQEEQKSGRSKK